MPSPSYSLSPLWREFRAELSARLRDRAARRALARELADYTSPRDLADLEAILDRHPEHEAAPVRRLMAAHARG
ncbi:MAG TPA: hypothetical protein VK586_04215 [Streptosporangiaceae bacterium]|nr:hypothetical protein [Streptosporangiaceae bacterium]